MYEICKDTKTPLPNFSMRAYWLWSSYSYLLMGNISALKFSQLTSKYLFLCFYWVKKNKKLTFPLNGTSNETAVWNIQISM